MTKDHQKAVALRYQADHHSAPLVTAKGEGKIAEDIIQFAKQMKVPVQEDESLVELLSQLSINESIPAELYEVVAELFAFIYRIDRNQDTSNVKD